MGSFRRAWRPDLTVSPRGLQKFGPSGFLNQQDDDRNIKTRQVGPTCRETGLGGSRSTGQSAEGAGRTMMSAEAHVVGGAAHGTASDARINSCNGYRQQERDIRVRTMTAAAHQLC